MQRSRRNRKSQIKTFSLLMLLLLGLPLIGSMLYLLFQPFMGLMIAGYLGIMIHFTNQKIGQRYYDFAFRDKAVADTLAFQNARSYRDHLLCGLSLIGAHCSLALLAPFSLMMLSVGICCCAAYILKLYRVINEVTDKPLHKEISNKTEIPASYKLGMDVQAKWGEYFQSIAIPYTYLPLTNDGIWFQIGREAAKREHNAYENATKSALRLKAR